MFHNTRRLYMKYCATLNKIIFLELPLEHSFIRSIAPIFNYLETLDYEIVELPNFSWHENTLSEEDLKKIEELRTLYIDQTRCPIRSYI